MINILIVDDHLIVREGIKRIINDSADMSVIAEASSGMEALELQDGLTAAKKFTEAELLFPQSVWAPRAALMAAYAYFTNNYYNFISDCAIIKIT